jgi:hypothetical protein
MPAPASPRTRLAIIIGGVVVVILAIAMTVVAVGGDDSKDSPSTGPDVIQSPATVTGLTAVPGTPTSANTSTDIPGLGVLQRALTQPGSFDCTTAGIWQPYAELGLALAVGEPAAGSTCTGEVIDLPFGYCSTAPCTAVPEDWRVDTRPGVQPESLLLVVAPNASGTAEYICVVGLVPQPKQILLSTTTIEQACPAGGSSNSIDLPYIPPDTSDIYIPPPISVDIATG